MEKKFILREMEVKYKSYKKVKSLKFSTPSAIYEIMKDLEIEGREVFVVFYLNSNNEIIAFRKEFTGTVDQAVIYPREVAKHSLLNNATRVIFVHNHPSGNCKPSEHDIGITKRLKSGLELLEIEVLDHIIIGNSNFHSFREHGIL